MGFLDYICPFCKTSEYVVEDKKRVEVYCERCGLVLASAPPYFASTIRKYFYPYGFLL